MRNKRTEELLDESVRSVLNAAWAWSAGDPKDQKNGDALRRAVARWIKAEAGEEEVRHGEVSDHSA